MGARLKLIDAKKGICTDGKKDYRIRFNRNWLEIIDMETGNRVASALLWKSNDQGEYLGDFENIDKLKDSVVRIADMERETVASGKKGNEAKEEGVRGIANVFLQYLLHGAGAKTVVGTRVYHERLREEYRRAGAFVRISPYERRHDTFFWNRASVKKPRHLKAA